MRVSDPVEAEGRAYGKIILLGEHGVVHGTKALSSGLKAGVRVTALSRPGPLSVSVPKWNRTFRVQDGSREGNALEQIALALKTKPGDAELVAHIEIPTRAGLGSSAALSGAIARALGALRRLPIGRDGLFLAVQASETIFHGNPSGLDARTALLGGLLVFSKSEGATALPYSAPNLAIFHSGHPGDTASTVAHFRSRLKEKEGHERLGRISELVDLGIDSLKRNDLHSLGRLMTENHEHLDWFGVSSPSLNRIVSIAKGSGALGAKLTGGGGGGCAIVLTDPEDENTLENIRKEGYEQVLL